jgi:hypothetical protein
MTDGGGQNPAQPSISLREGPASPGFAAAPFVLKK